MLSTPWWSHVLLLLAAAIVGAAVPLQAGTNAQLAKVLGHPLWATAGSLSVSLTLTLTAIAVLRVPVPRLAAISAGPLWVWVGGLYGMIFLITSLLVAPRLGAAAFMVAVIGGQVIASLVIDRFALAGFEQKPITPWRLAGVALIIGGIFLIQFNPGGGGKAKADASAEPGNPPEGSSENPPA